VRSDGVKEYFDELLHYKDDVDLAYRLQWAGWPALFVPQIKVWHDRLTRNLDQSPSLVARILKGRNEKSNWAKENSFFGQQVVLRKNVRPGFSLKVRVLTFLYQWASIVYSAVFEWSLLSTFRNLDVHAAEIEAKRKAMPIRVKAATIEILMS